MTMLHWRWSCVAGLRSTELLREMNIERMSIERLTIESIPADDSATFGSYQECALWALCSSPLATTLRIRSLLDRWKPADAFNAVASGSSEVLDVLTNAGCRLSAASFRDWTAFVSRESIDRIAAHLAAKQERVWWFDPYLAEAPAGSSVLDPLHGLFADDDDRPPVLFLRGDMQSLLRPRVAIVGTRKATSSGREMARLLGRQLSDRGIAVVSGLALGIDAASHLGALASADAKPIGIVGSGLDVIYPAANTRLWAEVSKRGILISELPSERGPTPGTFPARNRIIAQIAQVLVVVESAATGGSLITVNRALERGRPIMAVPGSPLHPASSGTNELLRPRPLGAVAVPCLEVADILTLLDFEVVTQESYVDTRSQPQGDEARVLEALGWDDLTVGAVASRTALDVATLPLSASASGSVPLWGLAPLSLAHVSLSLARLEEAGWVCRAGGKWRRLGVAT
jgi:DNA protecting protein DprA